MAGPDEYFANFGTRLVPGSPLLTRGLGRASPPPEQPGAPRKPVGAQQQSEPWRGVAGEGLVGERGWEYRRRQPEGTVLYEAVRENLPTLLVAANEPHPHLPLCSRPSPPTGLLSFLYVYVSCCPYVRC